ncbi:hypothetical protein HXX76_006638 [Chlamydomonas incerta]|uniref:Uncharacterized protein n=1 Tax=Chlamydomonas incerta TaxID=51695 RepID=A0A835T002_CHLIN|nr:hypothetical protein HXX76_006638 [Chlamydomonas incerta]|eukprot:KAG2436329.1 hypothetical protein HXX76_006638 [Chlamydomonas incerta]
MPQGRGSRGRGKGNHEAFTYVDASGRGGSSSARGGGRGGRGGGRAGRGAPARNEAGFPSGSSPPGGYDGGRGSRGGGRGGRGGPSRTGEEGGGGRGGRGGRGAGAAQLGTSPYGRGGGGGFSSGAFTPTGAGGGGRGGAAGGRSAGRTPGSAGRGAGGPGHHKGALAGPAIYGLANQFLFVELEVDGVWKVSVPNGQRFSRAFLAGLEVWARQVLAGEEPVLQRAVAAAAKTPTAAAPSSSNGAGASSAGRVPNFIPPPPPPGAGAHPITALTGGSGLPGLDTIAKAGGGGGRAAAPSLTPPPPPPPAAPLATGRAAAGANPAADGALDFVSMLQAQLGMGGGGGGAAGGNFATPGSAAADGNYTGSVRVDGAGREGAAEVGADAESPAAPAAAAAAAEGAGADAAAGEYRGLMAAVEEGMAAAGPVSYNPFALDGGEGEGEGEEEQLEEEGAGLEEEGGEYEDQGEEDQGDEEQGEEDEEAYLDDYDEARDDFDESEEGEEEDEDEEGDFDDDDRSYDAAAEAYLADLEEQDMHLGDPDRRATTPAVAAGGSGSAAKAAGRPAPPPLAAAARGSGPAAAFRSFIPPPPPAVGAATPPPPPPPAPIARAAAAAASPAPPAPAAAAATPGGRPAGSAPLSLGLLRQLRSLDDSGRLRVSLRLERQALNDTELEMVADWYEERASSLLVPAKLWLFDNRIGDAGAAAVARSLLHPALQELHLSHNFIGDKGAAALAAALPSQRPAGLRPLWLRLEWNVLNVDALRERLDEQAAARGLVTDIPRIEPTNKPMGRTQPGGGGASSGGGFAPGHELKLVLQRGVTAAVQLPWVTCQKQAPSEADVLRAVKGFYRDRAPEPASAAGPAATTSAPKPPLAPAAPALTPPSKAKPATPLPPPVLPEPQPGDERYRPGPLLLFPDTSALLAMLGGNASQHAGPPPLDWGLLLELAGEGRFGRSLPPEEQVFIVVADSVMKQLDGLKSSADSCAAIRRFMRDGLEQAGPAGYDFLTLLGSHEGEGLALEAGGLEGLAGSRSAAVSSRGQAVDMKIVEVALFFQAEVARAIEPAAEGAAAAPSAACMPVILLSNDNGQIASARSHGLPAFRLSSATDLTAQLTAVRNGGGALTATLLRRLLAPQATKGLGSTATRSVQEHFDGAVGTLRGVVDALAALVLPLEQVTALAQAEGDSAAALAKIRDLLAGGGGAAASASGSGGLAAGVSALLSGLRSELAGWEGVIKSHQAPSRLVQWAALTPGGSQQSK